MKTTRRGFFGVSLGGLLAAIGIKSGAVAATLDDSEIMVIDTERGPMTITLPEANRGREVTFKRGVTSVRIMSDGVNWHTI